MLVDYGLAGLGAAVVAWWLTGLLRRYALRQSLLDVPGERSSHSIPTPRGGGVAIVITFLLGLLALGALDLIGWRDIVALFGAGTLVAGVGFIDDHRHLAARWRLLAHFAGVAWLLFWLDGMPPIAVLGFELEPELWLTAVGAVYLVWLINLYNFMDGIDGIAGVEAITVAVGGMVLAVLTAAAPLPGGLAPGLLVAAVAGFLVWNFPRARIFMGDAGSGFLGLMLGALSLLAARENPALFWSWQILLGVFVVDATMTLARRILEGERFYEAHRSHAYQHAARRVGSHRPVTLAVAAVNMLWLLPIAALVATARLDGVYGLLIAYLPLAAVALYYNAGMRERPGSAG